MIGFLSVLFYIQRIGGGAGDVSCQMILANEQMNVYFYCLEHLNMKPSSNLFIRHTQPDTRAQPNAIRQLTN